jgi:hypothetical protein
MQRSCVLGMVVGIAMLACAAVVCADTVTFASTSWTTTNYYREYSDGGSYAEDGQWCVMDNVPGSPYMEYMWLNPGTAWMSTIPTGATITSATMTFAEASGSDSDHVSGSSVFEALGTDKGRAAMGIATGGTPTFYKNHTAYGYVSAAQINATGPITYDIKDLVVGWRNGSVVNPGKMMIVGDGVGTSDYYNVRLGVSSGYAEGPSFGPTLTITYSVPEPSTLVILATGLLGLLAYAWRKQT